MLTSGDLRRALEAIHESAPVHAEDEVGSTNTFARDLAAAGAPEWTLVSARHQTTGRGRQGRRWVDVPGRALMCSVVLRPAIEPPRAGLLALLGGAALALSIREIGAIHATCKWPNDVLVDGAKVAGVLAESVLDGGRLRYVILGVGVNLDAPDEVPGAGGLGDLDAADLLRRFLEVFHRAYASGEEDLAERVTALWLPVSSTIGRMVEARVVSGDVARGRAVGIDRFGGLVLSTDAGERTVAFGDVTHLG
jgi:BirA family biotin operon repressor/biotin-[acetyl-CoA-carboxylase] ligase